MKEEQYFILNETWLEHKAQPYEQNNIPKELIGHFEGQQESINMKIIEQWNQYLAPNEKTNANWEYIKKPQSGYLVPLMTGYKAISKVYPAGEIEGARDTETDVVFVEAMHSIGEWQSVHRLKKEEDWQDSVWSYSYGEGWYLCQQETTKARELLNEPVSDDVYY
jgi:CRISPR-associated protein Csy2